MDWKAVKISNYAKTFPLCIPAYSRLPSHYTNSNAKLGRSPLKQLLPLLPVWYPQEKSGDRVRQNDQPHDAGIPSLSSHPAVAHICLALPLRGLLASQFIWGQALSRWACIARCCGAPGRQWRGTQHPVPTTQAHWSYPLIAESCSMTPVGLQRKAGLESGYTDSPGPGSSFPG